MEGKKPWTIGSVSPDLWVGDDPGGREGDGTLDLNRLVTDNSPIGDPSAAPGTTGV